MKRVRFSNTLVSATEEIPSLSCYNEEELDAVWYSRLEVDTITHEANELILKAEESPEGTSVRDLEGESLRGLERKTEDGHVEAFLSRCAVYDAVLGAQVNVEKIAQLCQAASSNAKFAAYQRAKQDEAEVQMYLFVEEQEPMKDCSLTEHMQDLELDLMEVFSKSSPALAKQNSLTSLFQKEASSSFTVKADASWITRGGSQSTEATEASSTACESVDSFNSFSEELSDLSDTESTANTSTSTVKRPALTKVNSSKILIPAVPRPKARHTLPKRRSSSFKRTNQTPFPSNAPRKKPPTPLLRQKSCSFKSSCETVSNKPKNRNTNKPLLKQQSTGRLSLQCSAFF